MMTNSAYLELITTAIDILGSHNESHALHAKKAN